MKQQDQMKMAKLLHSEKSKLSPRPVLGQLLIKGHVTAVTCPESPGACSGKSATFKSTNGTWLLRSSIVIRCDVLVPDFWPLYIS